jgi:hypothetical protein
MVDDTATTYPTYNETDWHDLAVESRVTRPQFVLEDILFSLITSGGSTDEYAVNVS